MSYFDTILLGIIQGLTEFLPVSSSGHLVLAEHFLNVKIPGVTLELVLHLGTLLAVLIYFHKKILTLIISLFVPEMKPERRMILYLIVGSIPAGFLGFFFKDFFENAFSSPVMTSIFLIITGFILLSTALFRIGRKEITFGRSIIIGLGQAAAILPGISRSGTTISAGLFVGVNPVMAAEFSFLLSIPAIGGAVLLKAKDILEINASLWGHYFAGAVVSFLFGLLSVYLLLGIIKKGKFKYFGVYCLVIGLIGLIHFM
jgi:undecaprenyl-diphosphatase